MSGNTDIKTHGQNLIEVPTPIDDKFMLNYIGFIEQLRPGCAIQASIERYPDKPEFDCAYIHGLHIQKKYRRQGLATRLLNNMISRIRSSGWTGDITIEAIPGDSTTTKEGLVKLYTRLGLKVINLEETTM